MKNLHLVCNAHIDPVWLWELEEGIAETLSTFRVCAQFCEEYDGFIFNHNEALLYQWVEKYEPSLFKRIQKLVAEKKWHIMGGWFIQPDCNIPSGESFVRQILEGRGYFMEKFGSFPTTCINFDAFGHTRGLVDILRNSGYDSYLFCRPEPDMIELPDEDFAWEGFSGETIMCNRAFNSYESHRGEAHEKIKTWMENNRDRKVGMVLWGIGDHGGGPSRIDYEKISKLAKEEKDFNIVHSTPEAYFAELKNKDLPVFNKTLNPRYIGCYTSQIRIKQLHRQLENELYITEKMAAHASSLKLMKYPQEGIQTATKDMLFMEFHDILPGSSIQPVENYSISLAGHGLDELKTIKTQAFLSLCSGQKKADEGEIPLLVYNPHPYEVPYIVECEFQLADQNKNRNIFANPVVYQNGRKLPCQVEKEASNFNVDWRKKSVFYAKLKPGQINRFDVRIEMIDAKPLPKVRQTKDMFIFKTKELTVHVSKLNGTIDKYEINGTDYITKNAFLPVVIKDDENSWAHKEKSFRNTEGFFKVMDKEEGNVFSGIIDENKIESVRVIEDGAVRTIIEAVLKYDNSFICIRYYLPKKGTQIKVTAKVYWHEKMKMLKFSIPTTIENASYVGQQAYGSEKLMTNGDEMVSHKWNVLYNKEKALSVINTGTYGSDVLDNEMRISLLRSAGYSAGKSDFSIRNKYIMPQDRFSPYMDQGERDFEFYLDASDTSGRLNNIEREAAVCNEKPMALSFFPTGEGKKVKPFALLSDDVITMPVFKRSEDKKNYVIRLFNPTGSKRTTVLKLPMLKWENEFELDAYQLKSFKLDNSSKQVVEIDLVEREKLV
ncbi:MAG TPA: glycoside hydrolase family 38 C-terminal domain-containing protein [Clostridia bacterium]|nr:glycoside hydrolase family 38 C-terminal domain-containing protein [Clostridia bacterium]